MKVFAISDLHLSTSQPKPMDIFGGVWDNYMQDITDDWNARVSDNDIVLIAGDLSWAMNITDAMPDLAIICALRGRKVVIRGNHDYWWKSISGVRKALSDTTYAVQNDYVKIENFIICGSRGWTTPEGKVKSEEDKKIYDRELLRMELSLAAAFKAKNDNDKVIAMIHYPPFNSKFEVSPFTQLFSKYRPDAVVYGHLHGQSSKTLPIVIIDGIKYYLTSCDIVKNKLVEIF